MARNARVCRGLYFVRSSFGTLLGEAKLAELCSKAGHRWRAGVLNPVTTIHLFLLQILHGNTACGHLRHLSGLTFTTSGYCQARRRLPVEFFEGVLHVLHRRPLRIVKQPDVDEQQDAIRARDDMTVLVR